MASLILQMRCHMKIPARSSFVLLPSAILLGLVLPQFSAFTRPLLEIALIVMMTVSTTKLSFAELANALKSPGKILAVVGINYGASHSNHHSGQFQFCDRPSVKNRLFHNGGLASRSQ